MNLLSFKKINHDLAEVEIMLTTMPKEKKILFTENVCKTCFVLFIFVILTLFVPVVLECYADSFEKVPILNF